MQLELFMKPRLKHSLAIECVKSDILFLMGEHDQHVFQGETFVKIAPLLDGEHTIAQIASRLGVPFFSLYAVIGQLQYKKCLVEGENRPQVTHTAFWDSLDADTAVVAENLEKTIISVTPLGDLDPAPFLRSLRANGMKIENDGDLLIVLTDDYLRPELAEINGERLASGRPWMLVKPKGMVLWAGPLLYPGATGCWHCLAHRLEHNRQVEFFVRKRTNRKLTFNSSRAMLPATLNAGLNLAVAEIAKTLVSPPGRSLEGQVLIMDLMSMEMSRHPFTRRPQCPTCGEGKKRKTEPIRLQSRPKLSGSEEGQRSVSPVDTFLKYKHHISPVTGIVTSLIIMEKDHDWSHNVSAGHYFPVISDDTEVLQTNLVARSGGKGKTEQRAKTSALCESLERYSGIYWGDEPMVHSSYEELGDKAIPIRDICGFSERQYTNRKQLNREAPSIKHIIPEAVGDTTPMAWTTAWSLTNECVKYLPAAYCYYGYQDPGGFYCAADSNGNAAGNSLEEAIVQGFMELVERDAVALWWYNRVRLPEVDIAGFGIPFCGEMHTLYTGSLNRSLHVLDLSNDLGIPTFAAVSKRETGKSEDVIVGFSAHLNPKTAMLRAMEELNQYLPALAKTDAEGNTLYQFCDSEVKAWWETASYETQPYLLPDPDAKIRKLSNYPVRASNDIKTDVETCMSIVRERGLEVLVVDQTRPDVDLPVAKVVVPGLRHFWRRLGPGRIYDVPVALKWRDTPCAEEDLNPISCFV